MSDANRERLRPLRATVVAPFGVVGGAERWLLQLLDATTRLDVDAVLLQDGELRRELIRRGIPVKLVPTGRHWPELARSVYAIATHLRLTQPEVMLANGVKAAAVALPAARLTGVASVWAKHDFSFDSRLARLLAGLADKVVANSDAVARATGRADATLIPPPLPSWKPASRDQASCFWSARGLPREAGFTVAMVGRLVPYKGIDMAIRALSLPTAAAWRLAVVGAEDPAAKGERTRLSALAGQCGVDDRVYLLDAVADAGRWLAGFDAVAVLTRMDDHGFGREGFSIVALEAVAAGVPLIGAHDSPVVRRLAESAGVAVSSNSPVEIAAALRRLTDPAVRRSAARSRDRLLARHPDAASAADMLAAELAAAAGRPGAGLSSGPPVTVVTSVRNESTAINDLVDAVSGQLGPDDEYVVVDDGSTDSTPAQVAAWIERDPRIRLLRCRAVNAAAGRNAGIAAARHAVVACIDAGCTPDPGWLEALRLPFAEERSASLVIGTYRVSARTSMEQALAVACFPDPDESRRRGPFVRAYAWALGRTFDARRLDARSMAVTVEAWRAAGGFPEQFGTDEDLVFGQRVIDSGRGSVLAIDAEVTWRQRPSLTQTARMYHRYGRGDGSTRETLAVARNLVRAVSYAAAPAALWHGGPRARSVVLAAGVGYLSLPVTRVVRQRRSLSVLVRLPVALAVKDIAKAAGCVQALLKRR